MQTLRSLCAEYILTHELAETSADQYHKIVSVFCSWHHADVPLADFTGLLVSRFLLDKQAAGLSSYYRRSLRNSLVAMLRFAGKSDRVRPVRADDLEPDSWTPSEVQQILVACERLRGNTRQRYWRTLIATAYYTGLSGCDLHRLDATHIDGDGTVRIRRSKTGKRVAAKIPAKLADELATMPNPFWPLHTSGEAFRATFRRIVSWAGLSGSFKKLRKTAGTEAENLYPGCGHMLLANSRKVFEQHYLASNKRPMISPPPLPDPPDRAA